MYENIKKRIAEHEAQQIAEFNSKVETMTAGEILDSWYYRERTTPKTFDALKETEQNEKPDADTLDRIKAKNARIEKKRTAERLHKLERAEAAPVANVIDVSVEWKRSANWGHNPHATIYASAIRTEATASGFGYDKESAAISSAMNENPEIMRILYDHAETGEPFPYSVYIFAGVPYFDGGCGVSCFYKVFEACGYDFRDVAHGKSYDAYTIERKQ